MAKTQDPWAIDALIITLADSDERVCQAAVEGLEKLTNQTFGEDRQKWLHWWEQSQDDFNLATAPSDP